MRRKTVAMATFSLSLFGLSVFGFGYEVMPVLNGATIVGKVVFIGTPPVPRVFDVNKERAPWNKPPK